MAYDLIDPNSALSQLSKLQGSGYADLADLATGLEASQKQAVKLAKLPYLQAEQQREAARGTAGPTTAVKDKQSPLISAVKSFLEKAPEGALLFAAFGAIMLITGGVASTLFGGIENALLKQALTGVFAAASMGATWVGANAAVRSYREARSHEDSRLNQVLDTVSTKLGKGIKRMPEAAIATNPVELGMGSAAPIAAKAALAEDSEASVANRPVHLQAILEQGPRQHAESLLNKATATPASHVERLEQSREVAQATAIEPLR